MKLVTAAQMRALESYAIEQCQIPSLLLMENAAIQLFQRICSLTQNASAPRICCIVNHGNNGGDGLALARHLFLANMHVTILLFENNHEMTGDTRLQRDICQQLHIPTITITAANVSTEVRCLLAQCDWIVDGIFGTGLTRDITGILKDVIHLVNDLSTPVLSIDIPSGLHADTGKTMGCCIHATETVTFGFAKLGLFLAPGYFCVGHLTIADISLPTPPTDAPQYSYEFLQEEEIQGLLPVRPVRSNKGTFGRTYVFSGNEEMTGAPFFCSKSTYRMGGGLVYGCFVDGVKKALQQTIPEIVFQTLADKAGTYCEESFAAIKNFHDASVVILGPGIGTTDDVALFVAKLLPHISCPTILDADALTILSQNKTLYSALSFPCIITPHPGEMARLTGYTVADILEDPVTTARDFSMKHGLYVVLKDFHTIVAAPSGAVYVNTTGNSAMAKAGSGDVLCGMIAGLLAQGLSPYDACKLGTYLHGRCGEFAAKTLSCYSVTASDLIAFLPDVLTHYTDSIL